MQLHLAWLSSPGETTPSFCLIFSAPRGYCACTWVCILQQIIVSAFMWLWERKQRQWHKDKERQRTTETEQDCIKRHQTALSSFKFGPSETECPAFLPALPVCRRPLCATECFEAAGKQVLICYLCEKLRLNEGFTSYDQRWRGTRWLRILVAFGYHYVKADPFSSSSNVFKLSIN